MIKALMISGSLVQDHEFIYPYYRLLEEDIHVDARLLGGKPVNDFGNKNFLIKIKKLLK